MTEQNIEMCIRLCLLLGIAASIGCVTRDPWCVLSDAPPSSSQLFQMMLRRSACASAPRAPVEYKNGDRAARRLSKEGAGKMYCLAGVGGHIEDMLLNVQAASKILAIDGCPKDCALQTLAHAGFNDVAHLRLTDLGLQKGSSPATDERISEVVERAKPPLARLYLRRYAERI
jgi:uncharacterized metal-binding protein